MPVPTSGNFDMFGVSNTTVQGAIVEGGGSAGGLTNFNALINASNTELFDPQYAGRVDSLTLINQTSQYRNYPKLFTSLSVFTNLGSGWSSSTQACSASGSISTVYVNGNVTSLYDAFINGKIIYSDQARTIPFNGGNLFFKDKGPSNSGGVFQLGTDGSILTYNSGDSCIITPSTPITPYTISWSTTTNTTGVSGCSSAGWTFTNSNYSIRYSLANSLNCSGGTCGIRQIATATATITTGGSSVRMFLNFTGNAERQDTGYEAIRFSLNGGSFSNQLLASATSPGGKQQCSMGPVISVWEQRPPYILQSNTTYTFNISFDSNDQRFHVNAFYQVDLTFYNL